MAQITIPAATIEIPDDLDAFGRIYVGGQVAITAVINAFGDLEVEPGTNAMSTDELLGSLSMALSMLIAADSRNSTPMAVRKDAEKWGKAIGAYAKALKEQNDQIGAQILQGLNLRQSSARTN